MAIVFMIMGEPLPYETLGFAHILYVYVVLEAEHKAEAHTILLYAWAVVVHAAHIVDSKELEDVVYTYCQFPIWCFLVHKSCRLWELEEQL